MWEIKDYVAVYGLNVSQLLCMCITNFHLRAATVRAHLILYLWFGCEAAISSDSIFFSASVASTAAAAASCLLSCASNS